MRDTQEDFCSVCGTSVMATFHPKHPTTGTSDTREAILRKTGDSDTQWLLDQLKYERDRNMDNVAMAEEHLKEAAAAEERIGIAVVAQHRAEERAEQAETRALRAEARAEANRLGQITSFAVDGESYLCDPDDGAFLWRERVAQLEHELREVRDDWKHCCATERDALARLDAIAKEREE